MINEEKIILMTQMAAFVDHEGKKDTKINEYFKSDYVGMQVLKSVVSATIVYVIFFMLYIVAEFDEIMANLYTTDLATTGKRFLIYYFLLVGVYAIISYIIYSYRYTRMRRKIREYYNNLHKLYKMYNKG